MAPKSGRYSEEEDIFIAAIKLGTDLSWKKIEEVHKSIFPTPRAARSLESHFNRDLKMVLDVEKEKRQVTDIIDDYRHYGKVTYPEDQAIIDKALEFLKLVNKSERLW